MQTAYMSLGEACERLRIPPRTFRQLMADFGDLIEAPRPSGDGRLMELSVFGVERLQEILQLRNRGVTTEAIREQLQAVPHGTASARAEVAVTAETAAAPPPETAGPTETDDPEPTAHADTAADADVAADQATTDDRDTLAAAVADLAGDLAGDDGRADDRDPATTNNGVAAVASGTATVDEDVLLQRQSELVDTLERLTGELSRSEERRVDERDRLLTTLIRTQREIQQLRYEVAAHLTRKGRKQQSWVSRWFG